MGAHDRPGLAHDGSQAGAGKEVALRPPEEQRIGWVNLPLVHLPASDLTPIEDATRGDLMAAQPPRRTDPVHLNAHLVPLERALTERARKLEEAGSATDGGNELHLFVAAEWRALAQELHHW